MLTRRFWCRSGAAALTALTLLGACGKSAPPTPAPPAAKPTQKKVEGAGIDLYRQGLAAEDEDQALTLFDRAIRTNPRLTEAWYELGRRKVKQATVLVKTDELRAVQMFREGLEAEREAARLLDEGTVTLWSTPEQGDARLVLDTDLQNADEGMSGPDALLSALRQRTH
jgi:hypothetical protein